MAQQTHQAPGGEAISLKTFWLVAGALWLLPVCGAFYGPQSVASRWLEVLPLLGWAWWGKLGTPGFRALLRRRRERE